MKLLKKGYVLKQKDLKDNLSCPRIYDYKETHHSYILKIEGKKYLVRRFGSCNPKKCNSACCKLLSFRIGEYFDGESTYNYFKGFSSGKIGVHCLFHKKCKFLNKKGLCSRWKNKSFPGSCKEFPHPYDGVYVAIMSKCNFKFIIDEVIQ